MPGLRKCSVFDLNEINSFLKKKKIVIFEYWYNVSDSFAPCVDHQNNKVLFGEIWQNLNLHLISMMLFLLYGSSLFSDQTSRKSQCFPFSFSLLVQFLSPEKHLIPQPLIPGLMSLLNFLRTKDICFVNNLPMALWHLPPLLTNFQCFPYPNENWTC